MKWSPPVFLPVLLSFGFLMCGERTGENVLPAGNAGATIGFPGYSCNNLGVECPDPGHLLYLLAAEMWEDAFKSHYDDSSSPSPFYFSVSPDTLQSYLPNSDPCCGGVRIYFGLQNAVDSLSQVPSQLRLILIPFNQEGDAPFQDSLVIVLTPTAGMSRMPIADARTLVDQWATHYSKEPDFIVPVAAYNFSTTTMSTVITGAKSGNGSVCFLLGCHTIGIQDSSYCPPDSCRTCGSDVLAPLGIARNFADDSKCLTSPSGQEFGSAVVNLVAATKLSGGFQRSSDFARPCPRFCGKSVFSSPPIMPER